MKLCIIVCMLMIVTSSINAQIEKGNWALGVATTFNPSGNNSILGFGYTVSKFDDSDRKNKIFQFNFAPRIGYVIRKNLVVGLDIFITHSNSSSSGNISTFIGAGPFSRYYFKGNYLKPYAEIQGIYGNFSVKSEGSFLGNQDFDVRYLIAGGALGVAFPIKNSVHIDLAAAYNYQNSAFTEDDINQNSHGIGLKVGVTVFLDKTKNRQN